MLSTPLLCRLSARRLAINNSHESHRRLVVELRGRDPNGSCLFAAGHLSTLSTAKTSSLSLLVKHHILAIDEASQQQQQLHSRQPKLPTFLYSSNTTSWRFMRRANNNNNYIVDSQNFPPFSTHQTPHLGD